MTADSLAHEAVAAADGDVGVAIEMLETAKERVSAGGL